MCELEGYIQVCRSFSLHSWRVSKTRIQQQQLAHWCIPVVWRRNDTHSLRHRKQSSVRGQSECVCLHFCTKKLKAAAQTSPSQLALASLRCRWRNDIFAGLSWVDVIRCRGLLCLHKVLQKLEKEKRKKKGEKPHMLQWSRLCSQEEECDEGLSAEAVWKLSAFL